MDGLKNCPFCGGESAITTEFLPRVINSFGKWESFPICYKAFCIRCHTETATHIQKHMAVEAWNRRANNGEIH